MTSNMTTLFPTAVSVFNNAYHKSFELYDASGELVTKLYPLGADAYERCSLIAGSGARRDIVLRLLAAYSLESKEGYYEVESYEEAIGMWRRDLTSILTAEGGEVQTLGASKLILITETAFLSFDGMVVVSMSEGTLSELGHYEASMFSSRLPYPSAPNPRYWSNNIQLHWFDQATALLPYNPLKYDNEEAANLAMYLGVETAEINPLMETSHYEGQAARGAYQTNLALWKQDTWIRVRAAKTFFPPLEYLTADDDEYLLLTYPEVSDRFRGTEYHANALKVGSDGEVIRIFWRTKETLNSPVDILIGNKYLPQIDSTHMNEQPTPTYYHPAYDYPHSKDSVLTRWPNHFHIAAAPLP